VIVQSVLEANPFLTVPTLTERIVENFLTAHCKWLVQCECGRLMNEVRPEGTGHWGKSEAAREAGSIDQNTPSDRRMIVSSEKILK